MTQSIQPLSRASLNIADKDSYADKPEKALNLNQLLIVLENLNKTSERLSRHQNEIKMQNKKLQLINKSIMEEENEN